MCLALHDDREQIGLIVYGTWVFEKCNFSSSVFSWILNILSSLYLSLKELRVWKKLAWMVLILAWMCRRIIKIQSRVLKSRSGSSASPNIRISLNQIHICRITKELKMEQLILTRDHWSVLPLKLDCSHLPLIKGFTLLLGKKLHRMPLLCSGDT